MSHERLLRLGLLAVAPLVAAAPAHAATTVSRTGGDLRVTAAAGQANRILVRRVGLLHIVTDTGDSVAPGVGCVAAGANTAHCPALPNDHVLVASLDLDDSITAGGAIYGHYDGGSGADTINADPTTLARGSTAARATTRSGAARPATCSTAARRGRHPRQRRPRPRGLLHACRARRR